MRLRYTIWLSLGQCGVFLPLLLVLSYFLASKNGDSPQIVNYCTVYPDIPRGCKEMRLQADPPASDTIFDFITSHRLSIYRYCYCRCRHLNILDRKKNVACVCVF